MCVRLVRPTKLRSGFTEESLLRTIMAMNALHLALTLLSVRRYTHVD